MKMYIDPPVTRSIVIRDKAGRQLSDQQVRGLANCRIKRARRAGNRIVVMLEGPTKGAEGVRVYFANRDDYDAAIKKVFAA